MNIGLRIDKTVHFTGKKYISYGKHTMISQNSWLNVNERGGKRIVLGDYDFIGRNNFFTSGKLIEFGDFVITSVNCCFIGANHKYDDPTIPYMLAAAASNSVIKVSDNCFIGANATLLGDVTIGYGSLIGANTFVRNMVVPPFSLVVGTDKAKVIRRFSFVSNEWKDIDEWTAADEEALPSLPDYKQRISNSLLEQYGKKIPLPLKAVGKSNGNLYF